jgi:spore maturation protein CgeB
MTTAFYLEKAMRKICGVITHGPTISKDMLEQWDLLAIEKKVKNLQIPFLNGDMEDVLDQLPAGWEPDVFLYVDTGILFPPKNMSVLNCLKACYFIDSHLAFDLHLDLAENYDVVFTAHKPAVEMFKKKGIENVFWMPPACDPELHEEKAEKELYDIGFVGSLNPERVHLLNELRQRFNIYYERCFLEKMGEVFSQSKIVFHKSAKDGLAMRVFEVLASGSMLLTDEAKGSGLTDLFQDRKHIVVYRSEKELLELADYYLKNDDERREIAAEGMKKVLNEHTYRHRAEDMIKTLSLFNKMRALAS